MVQFTAKKAVFAAGVIEPRPPPQIHTTAILKHKYLNTLTDFLTVINKMDKFSVLSK